MCQQTLPVKARSAVKATKARVQAGEELLSILPEGEDFARSQSPQPRYWVYSRDES